MEYHIDLKKHPLSFYKEFIEASIKYYENVIEEFNKKDFYLGLFIAKQIKRIINNTDNIDINEINLLSKVLEVSLGKHGTHWDEMFFKFKNWKHNYIDMK